jgi:glycosyltransferase involved in cell wall biosynthesis
MARKDQARPRPKISAIVTTYNEEKNIGDCIRSLLWCDEIFVVDSLSTDRTPDIVRGFGDNVVFVQRTYFGSASQKNWAMDQVAHDWILIFDADERCLPKLQREIESLLARGPKHDAYTIHRRCFFLGKVLRFSGWQNDRMAETLDEYIPRILKYSFWGAAQGWRDGKQAGFTEVWGRSVWRFLRTYFFQLGILDGMHGVVFCLLQAFGTYMKWALLWSWRVNAKRGVEPDLPVFDEDEDVWRDLAEEEAAAERIADREAAPEPVRAGEE